MDEAQSKALAWAIEEARLLSAVTHSKARQTEFLRHHEALKSLAHFEDVAWERGYTDGQYDVETHHTTHNPYQPTPSASTEGEPKP